MKKQEIIDQLRSIKGKINRSNMTKYNFEFAEKIVFRLDSFSECNECKAFLDQFASIIKEMEKESHVMNSKKYNLFMKKVMNHLHREHKLVKEGYYTEIYMAYGIALGLPLGVIFSQIFEQPAYIGIGLPIGMGIGLSIGSKLDKEAKGQGLVI